MRREFWFVAMLLAVTIGGALATTFAAPGGAVVRAVWLSAGIAIVVQGAAFAIARVFTRETFMAGLAAKFALRMGSLLLYALVLAPAFGLPLKPALVSLLAFLLVPMFLEPCFLSISPPSPKP